MARLISSRRLNNVCEWRCLCALVCVCARVCVCMNEKSKWRGQMGGVGGVEGGTEESGGGGVGKWFSRWDPQCETMHPKETFSHEPITWIQIPHCRHPRSQREGQTHLAFNRSKEVHPLSFFSCLPPSNHKTHQRWLHGGRYDSSIYTFVLHLHLFCSYLESRAREFIMTGRVGKRLDGWNAQCWQRNAGEFGELIPEKNNVPPSACSQGYCGRFSLVSV